MTDEDSQDLTRVGPGTVMGEYMRQYWIPAAKSLEVKSDGDPIRLLILGERQISFNRQEFSLTGSNKGPVRF